MRGAAPTLPSPAGGGPSPAGAVLPLVAAVLAIGFALATGFDQRTPLPPELETRFYGFFLDRYPLFTLAIVYGLAVLAVRALRPGPAGWPRRLLGGALAGALLLAACLHPTFGGVTLRLAFASGGTAFLTQQPMPAAYALGSGLATLVFATILGLGALLIGNGDHAPRRWSGRLGRILVRVLALWFALVVLGLAHAAGFGAWPRRPLTAPDALLAVALAGLAFLPHILCGWGAARHPRSAPSRVAA